MNTDKCEKHTEFKQENEDAAYVKTNLLTFFLVTGGFFLFVLICFIIFNVYKAKGKFLNVSLTVGE